MHYIGKRVEFNTVMTGGKYSGQVWIVQRQLTKNLEMQRIDADGTPFGKKMRTPPSMITVLADDAKPVWPKMVEAHTPLVTGSLVRVNGVAKIDPNDLYVVMDDKGLTVKIVKLGGDGNRYWPSIPRTMLTPVNLADVLK